MNYNNSLNQIEMFLAKDLYNVVCRYLVKHEYENNMIRLIQSESTLLLAQDRLERLQLEGPQGPQDPFGQKKTLECDSEAFILAITNNHLNLARWIQKCGRACWVTHITPNVAVKTENIEFIKWTLTTFKNVKNFNTNHCLARAVETGNLTLVKFLFYNLEYHSYNHIIDIAAERGYLNVVKWLHYNLDSRFLKKTLQAPLLVSICSVSAIDLAAANGHLEVIQWLFKHRKEGFTDLAIESAAMNGHFDIVKCLVLQYPVDHSCKPSYLSEKTIDNASKNGHLHIIKWILETYGKSVYCTPLAIDSAARHGHLDLVKWFFENNGKCHLIWIDQQTYIESHSCRLLSFPSSKYRIFSTNAIDWAAEHGHLTVLQWLFEHCEAKTDMCTQQSINNAAQNGHLHIIKWLTKMHTMHNFVYIGTDAMDRAAKNGHLDVVKWLRTRNFVCSTLAIDLAAYYGHLSVIKWLCTHLVGSCLYKSPECKQDCCRDKVLCSSDAIDRAAGQGHLEIVKWLYTNIKKYTRKLEALCTLNAIDYAASNGHLSVVKFLVEHGEPFTYRAIEWAAYSGHTAIVKFILDYKLLGQGLPPAEVKKELLTHNAMNRAAGQGHYDLMRLLWRDYQAPYTDVLCLGYAIENGHLCIIEWLLSLDRSIVRSLDQ